MRGERKYTEDKNFRYDLRGREEVSFRSVIPEDIDRRLNYGKTKSYLCFY